MERTEEKELNLFGWAHELRMTDSNKYEKLKTFAIGYNLASDDYKEEIKKTIANHIPIDDEFNKMVEYVQYLDDKANEMGRECSERNCFGYRY